MMREKGWPIVRENGWVKRGKRRAKDGGFERKKGGYV